MQGATDIHSMLEQADLPQVSRCDLVLYFALSKVENKQEEVREWERRMGGDFCLIRLLSPQMGEQKQMGQTFRPWNDFWGQDEEFEFACMSAEEADIEPQHGPDVMNLAERTDASRTLYCWIPWFKWHQTQLHLPVDSHQSFLLRCDILSEFLITLVRKMFFNKRDILENPIPGESVRSFRSLLRRLIQGWEKQLAENRICFMNHFSGHYYNSLGKRRFLKYP